MHFKMMSSYINLFLFFISSSRTLVSPENCRVDSFKTEPDFDIRKFLGLWYHVTTLKDPNSNETLYDMKYYLKLNDNGSTTMHIAYWIPEDSQCTVYSNLLSSTKIPGKMQRMDIVNVRRMRFQYDTSKLQQDSAVCIKFCNAWQWVMVFRFAKLRKDISELIQDAYI
ncbi:hypothetical protein CHS0354_036026 [Potamilus streckersoni]|uniref:Lipocalin/cytosolic fatty-acid binding domain-containing protein n=1 Tax=Potamilus streckersoni TaxID=2493646 RepID=A0AAE0RMU8_9BIVA|nr:hypothetical protein CHS0354_036026 [Potamilus streckersoni]